MRQSSQKKNKSLSKSSKSVLSMITRKNPQESFQNARRPYFNPDPIRDTIDERVKTEKENYFQRQRKEQDHLGKADQIIKDLFKRHETAKQKLKKMKQETQKRYNEVHTFMPNKNKTQRYNIGGDVVRRNEIWLREKKKKQLQLKQEVTLNKLRQCTFSPSFSSKKQSQLYLKQRQLSTSNTPKKNRSAYNTQKMNLSPYKSGEKKRRDYTEEEYEQAKKTIITRMMGSLRE